MRSYAILNDLQIPFEDKKVLWDLVVPFIEELRPDGIVLNGDITDGYDLSDFTKNPLERADLKLEVTKSQRLMDRLSKAAKTGDELWWVGGNHEARLKRYIWKNAKALAIMDEVEFPNLFGLQHYGFRWKEYGDKIYLGKLMVTHGTEVSKHSGWTARNHFLKHGTSVLIGHTHRIGQYHVKNEMGDHAAFENGCLCRLDPEYDPSPNWQQGFAVVHVMDNGYFNVQQMRILERKMFFYGNDLIKAA